MIQSDNQPIHDIRSTRMTGFDTRSATGRTIGRLLAASLLPAIVLGGCASHSESNFTVGSVQSTYKQKHPIVIDENEKVLYVPVSRKSNELTYPAQSAIQSFAGEYQKGANGSVNVMIPSGSANEAAARRMLPNIQAVLAGMGIPRNRVHSGTYYADSNGASSPIRLSFTAIGASVEQCGKWTEDLAGVNGENQNYHNFGCAYQNNLAAMIANPADLLAPRGMTTIDAERRNVAIDKYRIGEVGSDGTFGSAFE